MHKPADKFKTKKKIRINSLEAAICNVALFKSMKDKDFRDSIFISYCQQGVILEALSENQWKKAHDHIQSFLHNKKIELLIDGYDKDQYEALINKGLKQITRKIRQSEEECPYINIIHYQKLRKSCQYMDKQKYVEPLKDWEKKNKKNPNFAFLIVQPKHKFDEIKRNLLEYLLNQPVRLTTTIIQPISFLYLLFYSSQKEVIKNSCNKKQIEISIEKEEDSERQIIKAVNFTNVSLEEYIFTIVGSNSKITKSGVGLEVITAAELRQELKNAKMYCKDNPTEVLQQQLQKIEREFGENFVVVPYKKQQKQKYRTLIDKYLNTKFSKQQIDRKLQTHKAFQFEQIQFLEQIYTGKNYKCWKVCINGCPFMIYQYNASVIDLDSFVIYLDQLQLYYCTYMIRFYGVIIRRAKENIASSTVLSYSLVFDYHRNNLVDMVENDMVLDSTQIVTIILQILYLVNLLHSHQQPRCLGPIEMREIFWPMATILPYLGVGDEEPMYSIENDVKQVGMVMKELIGDEEDEQLSSLISRMTDPNKYQRPSVKKCIAQLEDMLCL